MSIRKYGRYWAVYASDGALICITVYRNGATEVIRRLQQALEAAQQWQETNVGQREPARCSIMNLGEVTGWHCPFCVYPHKEHMYGGQNPPERRQVVRVH
jgi:hypothetical protein